MVSPYLQSELWQPIRPQKLPTLWVLTAELEKVTKPCRKSPLDGALSITSAIGTDYRRFRVSLASYVL